MGLGEDRVADEFRGSTGCTPSFSQVSAILAPCLIGMVPDRPVTSFTRVAALLFPCGLSRTLVNLSVFIVGVSGFGI